MEMLNKFFSGDNMLFKIFSVLTDVLAFSVLWLVCAVTVAGLGPGTTALYDAMARHRSEERRVGKECRL